MFERSVDHTCRSCNEILDYCLTCGEPILGQHLEFDGVGPYCLKCARERKPCDICTAPLSDEKWELSDGRVLCLYCHATAIVDKERAIRLYEEMKSVAQQLMGLSLNVPTGLALVDRNQLAQVIQQQKGAAGSNSEAARELNPERTLGLYVRRGMRRGLYVQAGLPKSIFLQVAAHEFAHAWQGENCPLLKEPVFHEGFAEWVAYRVLGYYGYSQGQRRMLDRVDIYGEGLRHIIDLFGEVGMNGLLEACKRMV